jgi:arginase family enzyme
VSIKRDPLPVFSGIPSFCRLPVVDRSALEAGMVAVAGVALDATCVGRIGSRFGPRAIRETSQYFATASASGETMIEVSTDQQLAFPTPARVVDINDLNIYPTDLLKTQDSISDDVCAIVAAAAMPVILGGDEYVTLPILDGFTRGWKARGASGVGYLQVSGHLALGDSHPAYGKHWGGATARRIIESGIVDTEHMAWVGIHGRCRGEEWDMVHDLKLLATPVSALRRGGLEAASGAALSHAGSSDRPVLVSLDMSVMDGAFAAGTSESSFDGLTNTELLMLMDALSPAPAQGLVLTGVNPRIEPTWTTERLATIAVLRFLAPRYLQPQAVAVAADSSARAVPV